MSAEQTRPMILAIGSRDDFLHVYQDEQVLLEDLAIGAGEGESSGPIEFFDSEGHRLTGKYDRQWRLLSLTPTTEQPNLALVRQRVQNCLDHVRSYIKGHPEKVDSRYMTVDEVLELVPDLGEPSEFEMSLKALLSDTGHAEEGAGGIGGITVRNWRPDPVHMYWHACGWQH